MLSSFGAAEHEAQSPQQGSPSVYLLGASDLPCPAAWSELPGAGLKNPWRERPLALPLLTAIKCSTLFVEHLMAHLSFYGALNLGAYIAPLPFML